MTCKSLEISSYLRKEFFVGLLRKLRLLLLFETPLRRNYRLGESEDRLGANTTEGSFLCILSITVNAIVTAYKAYITNCDEGVGFKLCAMCNKIINHILPCVLLKKNVITMVVGILYAIRLPIMRNKSLSDGLSRYHPLKYNGRCHIAWMIPSIIEANKGLNDFCNSGRAKPRHPNSSCPPPTKAVKIIALIVTEFRVLQYDSCHGAIFTRLTNAPAELPNAQIIGNTKTASIAE